MNIDGGTSNNSFSGVVDIQGNLDVSEDITCKNINVSETITAHTIVTEQELEVKDPLILCGKDNPADALNLGMIEEHKNGATDRYTGFVRSKDDKRHYLLNNVTPKPTPSDDIRPVGGLRSLLGDMVLNQLNCETLDADASLRCETGIVMAQNSTPWTIDPTKPTADGQVLAYNQAGNKTEWITNPASSDTMQDTYDRSPAPQIVTNATEPVMTIRQDPLAVSGSFFDLVNLAGTTRLDCKDDTLIISNLKCGSLGNEYVLPITYGSVGYGIALTNPVTKECGWIKYTEGPTSSTDNAIPRWDNVFGNKIQNSGWTIDDSGNMNGPSSGDLIVNSNVGINGPTTAETITVYKDGLPCTLQLRTFSNTPSHRSIMSMFRARGSEASPSAVLSGDWLSQQLFGGHDGTNFQQGAAIECVAAENWSGSGRGSYYRFKTAQNGTTALTERMRITDSGLICIGNPDVGTHYYMPNARGTDKQLLSSDGSGNLGWTDYTLQKAYENSALTEITTNTTNNELMIKQGAGASSLVLDIRDSSNTDLFNVDATDGVTVSSDFRYGKGCAEFYAEANVSGTTTTLAGTWYKVNFGTATAFEGQAIGFTVDTTTNVGRITYNGTRNRIAHLGVTVSFESDTNNVLVEFEVFKNGVGLPQSHVKMFYGNGVGKFESTAIHAMPTMSQNDYIELYVKSDTAGAILTIEECNIFALALPNVA